MQPITGQENSHGKRLEDVLRGLFSIYQLESEGEIQSRIENRDPQADALPPWSVVT